MKNKYFIIILLICCVFCGACSTTKKSNYNQKQPCYREAAQQFDRWVYEGKHYSKGLANRVAREKALFLAGCNN